MPSWTLGLAKAEIASLAACVASVKPEVSNDLTLIISLHSQIMICNIQQNCFSHFRDNLQLTEFSISIVIAITIKSLFLKGSLLSIANIHELHLFQGAKEEYGLRFLQTLQDFRTAVAIYCKIVNIDVQETVNEDGLDALRDEPLIFVVVNNADAIAALCKNTTVLEKYKEILDKYASLKICFLYVNIAILDQ